MSKLEKHATEEDDLSQKTTSPPQSELVYAPLEHDEAMDTMAWRIISDKDATPRLEVRTPQPKNSQEALAPSVQNKIDKLIHNDIEDKGDKGDKGNDRDEDETKNMHKSETHRYKQMKLKQEELMKKKQETYRQFHQYVIPNSINSEDYLDVYKLIQNIPQDMERVKAKIRQKKLPIKICPLTLEQIIAKAGEVLVRIGNVDSSLHDPARTLNFLICVDGKVLTVKVNEHIQIMEIQIKEN